MPDFVALLTEDHRRVEQLFKQFDETGDADVAQQIFLELTVHATVEEECVYGLYSSKVDSKGAMEARAEHQEAKDLIAVLEGMDPGTDGFVTNMTKLKTAVLHHVDEEEKEIFPKILESIPETAEILGDEIAARKAELVAQMDVDHASGMPASAIGQKPVASPEPGW
jgi:hemerythrin superfamily protein